MSSLGVPNVLAPLVTRVCYIACIWCVLYYQHLWSFCLAVSSILFYPDISWKLLLCCKTVIVIMDSPTYIEFGLKHLYTSTYARLASDPATRLRPSTHENAFAWEEKHVCCRCETCACNQRNTFALRVKCIRTIRSNTFAICVKLRIQRVCSALMDS